MRKETKKELKNMLRKELKEYEATIGVLSDEERNDLHEWVANGNSVHDNPGAVSGENGLPMDYINARRLIEEMAEMREKDPEMFQRGYGTPPEDGYVF